ncbi:type VI secretion system baseplate subunit TssF, partial [Vibrio caribbeanicus]|uniref:type VI secretion system baseplate subunit TssF n=1 Tax=Vibrio caribbeanicus TaxID=701175 RepID=UPI0030D9DDD9
MSNDPLLRYYEQELTLGRRALGQFEQQHPGYAERLNINQGKIEDPNLARLLDGVALLNANVEKKLAEQLPQVIEGLLSILYPSYTQVVPSVAYLKLDDDVIPRESYTLPKGSQFSAESQGQDCTF